MPYSRPVMTLIFNKLPFDGADAAAGDSICVAAPKDVTGRLICGLTCSG
jgi:hypothetical protein